MDIITLERNYFPVDIETRYHSCLRKVESSWPVKKILSFYHVKRSSLYRWLKLFDGTKESLIDKSHKPLSDHPRKLNIDIVNRVLNLHRRNPDQSYIEIWVRLRHDGVLISASSVLRILKRNNQYDTYKPAKKKHDKMYHTPKNMHEKWQIDVKHVPNSCKTGDLEGRYYQYTILDECSRKRYLYFTNEISMYETVKAIEYAYMKFGQYPKILQSDNGFEFSDKSRKKEEGVNIREYDNILEAFLKQNNIRHQLIRPRTPEHNGKVERSHRIDQDKFYSKLKFYSLKDLKIQGEAWNKRYNNIPKVVLGFKTPNEIELEMMSKMSENVINIRDNQCPTSFES